MDLVLQRAVNALSLEDNEEPLILSANPEYRAPEHHNRSILGRLLNPKVQKVSDIIHALPRKWGVFDRVRGIALSSYKFQFIFKYEEDLKRVLEIGVWTHEDWLVVLQRWTEFPPEDYLDIMPVWIRMRNVPYNFYAKKTFDDLDEIVGKVDILAYDEEKSQSRDYVRARVFFNVNNLVRKFRGLQLPNGENIKVSYEFERIRRRCYACQRLTHDRDHCPFLQALLNVESSHCSSMVLLPSDPLYGILSEEQVGLDHISGRPKIAESVLEEMRQYMIIENGLNKSVKAARIKASLK